VGMTRGGETISVNKGLKKSPGRSRAGGTYPPNKKKGGDWILECKKKKRTLRLVGGKKNSRSGTNIPSDGRTKKGRNLICILFLFRGTKGDQRSLRKMKMGRGKEYRIRYFC